MLRRKQFGGVIALLLLLALLTGSAMLAATIDPQSKLTANDGAEFDQFGYAVAIDGNTAIVGVPFDDDKGSRSGAAYIFTRSGATWSQQAKLTADDGAEDDQFGWSVAINGDTVVIGAPLNEEEGERTGAAYVFVGAGANWSQQTKLNASDGSAGDWFGYTVAVSGDTVMVGAPFNDDNGGRTGSAYVFTRSDTSWGQQIKLLPSDSAAEQQFGWSIAIEGATAVIGAIFDDGKGVDSGAAYIFTGSGVNWSEQAKLTAADGAANDWFGSSVSISGETAVIGAPADDDRGDDSGAAYVFTRSGTIWSQQAKLVASDGVAGDSLGSFVALDGDWLVAGAPFDDDVENDVGGVYAFTRSGTAWSERGKLVADSGTASDQFGFSVALSGETAVVGTPFDDDKGSAAGAAYIFDLADLAGGLGPGDDAVFHDDFGWAVAVSGDTAVIGAPLDDEKGNAAGAAYVFVRSGASWNEQAKLTASDGGAGHQFGTAVAIDGNTIVVGASHNGGGSAYIFTRSGSAWSEQQTIVANDSADDDRFGAAVAVREETIMIGAPLEDDKGTDAGAIYVFTRSGANWAQQSKLTASDGSGAGAFGSAVALGSGAAVVGAPGAGVAYVFTYTDANWSEQDKLAADDATAIGASVALSSDTAVVGAPGAGAAYVFTRGGADWSQQGKLSAPSGGFGTSVALSGGTALVGAPLDDGRANDAGATYVFGRFDGEWRQVDQLSAGDAAADHLYGHAVALDVVTAVIGAPKATELAERGAAYVETANVAPEIVVAPSADATEGEALALSGVNFSDPTLVDVHQARIIWGDGSSSEGGVDQNADTISASHVYTDSGTYAVTVTVSDQYGAAGSASQPLTVQNVPPTAQDDDAATTAGTPVSVDVLANDMAAPADRLSVQSVGAVAHGTVSVDLDGRLRYTPTLPFVGTETFTYVVADDDGATDSATVAVTVTEEAIADLTALSNGPTALGTPTTFTATVSAGTNVSYTWAFGDGTNGSGAVVEHVYPDEGTYTARVTATNSLGSQDTSVQVTVNEADRNLYLPMIAGN